MKKILITGGPTNETIDEVMKITNMSTGKLSVTLGEVFFSNGYEVTLILNKIVNTGDFLDDQRLKIIRIENTAEMMAAIEEEKNGKYDALIHASAVGDYLGEFTFLMEDMAEEIFNAMGDIKSPEDILGILRNPKCKLDNTTKISSYQENLTVKLGLTPKIIAKLKEWYPNTLLIGCKLLENVPKDELYSVAQELCVKNDMDYIMANDLADLRAGKTTRYLIDRNGFTGREFENPMDVFDFVNEEI